MNLYEKVKRKSRVRKIEIRLRFLIINVERHRKHSAREQATRRSAHSSLTSVLGTRAFPNQIRTFLLILMETQLQTYEIRIYPITASTPTNQIPNPNETNPLTTKGQSNPMQ